MRHVPSPRALMIVITTLSIASAQNAGAQGRPGQGGERVRPFAQPDTSASALERSPTRATPPRARIDTGFAILPPPASAPPPARIRRADVPSRQLAPTAAVVLPLAPGSPPPEVALRREPEAVFTPPPIERPAPPARAFRAEAQPLQNVAVNQTEPAGATGRCKDGTFLTGPVTEDRCTDKGGLAILIPARRVAPPRPLLVP